MKAIFDHYGFPSSNIDALAKQLEKVLGLPAVPRESSFKGNYYTFGPLTGENFHLQPNRLPQDPDEDEDWLEPNYKHLPTLLFVNRTTQSNEIRHLLESMPELAAIQILHKEIEIQPRATGQD